MPPKNLPTKASLSRRDFLALSTAVPAAMIAGSVLQNGLVSSASAAETPAARMGAKKYPIGIELYGVRTELAKDLPNTLRTVAKIGYEAVEFYAPYFAWTVPYAKEVKTLMD